MKRALYLSTLLSLSATAFAITNETPISGATTSGGRVNIATSLANQGLSSSNTLNLVLDSSNGRIYYRSGGFTAQTISVNDGAGDFNVADGLTLDANSDTEITIVNANQFKVASGTTTVKNSKSSTALVKLNFNDTFIVENFGYGPELYFKDINAQISTKADNDNSTYSIIGGVGVMTIGKTATVEMVGDELRLTGTAAINVDGSFKYNGGTKTLGFSVFGGKLNVNDTGIYTVAKDKAMTVRSDLKPTICIYGNGRFVMEEGSQIKLNSTNGIVVKYTDANGNALNQTSDDVKIILRSVNSDPNVVTWNANFTQENATVNASGVRLVGTSKILNTSNWKIDRRLQIGGENNIAASLTITDNSIVDITSAIAENKPTVELIGNATLILKKANAITQNTTGAVALYSGGEVENALSMSANQKFSELAVDTTLSIYLLDKALLEIENGITIADGEALKIYNFAEESVKVGFANQDVLNNIEIYDANQNFMGIASLVDGYLSVVAVPEPAEWAMIFGGIALALAIRRRK